MSVTSQIKTSNNPEPNHNFKHSLPIKHCRTLFFPDHILHRSGFKRFWSIFMFKYTCI